MTRHILKILILAISLLLTSGFGQGKLSQRDSLNAQLPNAKPREKMQIYLKLGELSEGKSYAQRISYFREALSLAQKFKSKQDEIKALNQIGELYYYSGDDKQAIQYTEEALHLGTSISDSKQVQVSLYNLGFIHQVLHNHEVAIDYFLKTLAIANEASDIEMSTRTLVSLGKSYHILKRYPEALDVYNQAKLQSIDIDNNAILGRIYSGIGDLYQIIGEYDKAIAYFDIVISINKKLENKPALAQNYCDIGIAYFHLMQYDQAETYFQKAIQNSQNDEFITNNFKLIADTYYESGRFEKAIQFYRLYTTQKDSLFNKEKQKAINDLQMAYENEKKDRKIFELMVDQENNTFTLKQRRNFLITSFSFLVLMAITLVLLFLRNNDKQKANIDLQKKSDKIAHQTAELEELIAELKSVNRTKDSLFSIIAHDLRGPLGVMKAWLDILADDQDFKNTDEYRQVVTDLKHSAGTTFTLLENLLSWARSQRDEIQYKPSINGLK
jgi:tetratricopeptide (TPR) repeat protein